MIYRFGKDMDYPPMMNFGSWAFHNFFTDDMGLESFHRTRGLYNLLAVKECAAAPYHESSVDDIWYRDVQLMASRSSNGLFVASHAGTNGESHNHNDVGDFIIYADGYPVIIDVGSGTYTARTFSRKRYDLWFNTSAYHNLPTINGVEQKDGNQFAASDVKYQKDKNGAELSMNINDAYPKESGIKTWERRVRMNRDKGIVKVSDKYVMSANLTSLTQTFMSVCSTDITTPGKIIFQLPGGAKVYLDYDKRQWEATREKINLTTPEDQGLKHSWDDRTIWRILLTNKPHKMKDSIAYTIHR